MTYMDLESSLLLSTREEPLLFTERLKK
uniref:Uncharacterized protein n=1 Tax=Arundo donax TaxID=35708 RepID=A0A0A9G308_ARUDO